MGLGYEKLDVCRLSIGYVAKVDSAFYESEDPDSDIDFDFEDQGSSSSAIPLNGVPQKFPEAPIHLSPRDYTLLPGCQGDV
jgi:hypothetical protein